MPLEKINILRLEVIMAFDLLRNHHFFVMLEIYSIMICILIYTDETKNKKKLKARNNKYIAG